MVTTGDLQKRLTERGYDPGAIDGVRGRRTVRAIRQFQTDKGLAPDAIDGPVTRSKLFGGSLASVQNNAPDLPWYDEARSRLRSLSIEEA